MAYTMRVIVKVPVALQTLGNRICRALDPDVGGHRTFDSLEIDGYVIADTRCTAEFAAKVSVLVASSEQLHALVTEDYSRRWPDLEPPTLADCQDFCSALDFHIDADPGGDELIPAAA